NIKTPEDLIGNLVIGLAPHTSAGIIGRIIGFTDAKCCFAHPYWHAAKRRNCDGDEDSIMLLMDALLNFSKKFLPSSRGGKMDAPLVLTTILNPKEVDDEVHKMEIVDEYPKEFYEATLKNLNPGDVKVKIVKDILNDNPYENLKFTHDNGNLNNSIKETKYVILNDMIDKVNKQLELAEKIRSVDEKKVAEILINSHFLRDIQGNLRSFSEQTFRCTTCNKIYRRCPLTGKCTCGGNLVLTISEGGIKKYLDLSINIAERYNVDEYLKQRLKILKNNVDLMFEKSKKQKNLADFW
ncbi:MAG: DNA polymerase II large subunit, partial [Candidatus Altarchaeaceae archaeon]